MTEITDPTYALVEKYAEILQDVHENSNVGDYTFEGILLKFLRELEGLQIPKSVLPYHPSGTREDYVPLRF